MIKDIMDPKMYSALDNPLDFNRAGGILLHPTSLPGEYGIGELGPNLFKFLDFLHDSGIKLWQILPLGPTGYGDSPYLCFSAFAGNPYLISIDKLKESGFLTSNDINISEPFPSKYIDFGHVINWKWQLLHKAYTVFSNTSTSSLVEDFTKFKAFHNYWLEDYATFMAIKESQEGKLWTEWPIELRIHEPKTLKEWKKKHKSEIEFQMFVQLLFDKQWSEIKNYAHKRGIRIIGDVPIFVALDSADVWAHSDIFYLDEKRQPIYVAGVPPDFFSETGQRWGSPLYRWDKLKENSYDWWVKRIQFTLNTIDIIRIDHFRGFEAYWEIQASEPTAIKGRWVKGPDKEIFEVILTKLGILPIIAEDLGIITPPVHALREAFNFPGMRILQFAFGDEGSAFTENRFLPHNFDYNTVVYTGTHDNATSSQWFENLDTKIKQRVLEYMNSNGTDAVGDFIRLAWSSVAKIAVIPLQDLLRLGKEARMNFPGKSSGNWVWRFTWDQIKPEHIQELLKLNRLYNR